MKKILNLALILATCSLVNAQSANLNLVSTSQINSIIKQHQKVVKAKTNYTTKSIKTKAKTGELIIVSDQFNGYAVQIFSGNKDEAFKARNRFVQLHPTITTKVRHSLPDYKVIVGEYIYRKDANRLRTKVRKQFGSSIVITNKIIVNERNKARLLKQVK